MKNDRVTAVISFLQYCSRFCFLKLLCGRAWSPAAVGFYAATQPTLDSCIPGRYDLGISFFSEKKETKKIDVAI